MFGCQTRFCERPYVSALTRCSFFDMPVIDVFGVAGTRLLCFGPVRGEAGLLISSDSFGTG